MVDHVILRRVLAAAEGPLWDGVREVLGEELADMLRRNPDHSVNLRSVCRKCHAVKTEREGNPEFVRGCARRVAERWAGE